MQKSKIKVVDDFLPIFEFAPIKNQMEGGEFPWYWQEHSHGNFSDGKFKGDNVPQLIHGFVEDGNASSHYYYFFNFEFNQEQLFVLEREIRILHEDRDHYL